MAKNTQGSKQSTPVWISSDVRKVPFITVDKQLRIYFNTEAQELIGAREVVIGYDHANKRMIIGNPRYVRPVNVKPHRIDRRGYTSARPFLRELGISELTEPLKYEYVGKDHTVDGALAFQRIGDDKAGRDGGRAL